MRLNSELGRVGLCLTFLYILISSIDETLTENKLKLIVYKLTSIDENVHIKALRGTEYQVEKFLFPIRAFKLRGILKAFSSSQLPELKFEERPINME